MSATPKESHLAPRVIDRGRRGALIGLSVLLGGCYLFQSSETFYGLKTAGQRIVFVVDISGSMEGKNEGTIQDRVTGAAVLRVASAPGAAPGGPG